MAFWHPTLSPGRCRKTCTPLVCWLVLIGYIFCYLQKGLGSTLGGTDGGEGHMTRDIATGVDFLGK